MLWYHKTCKKAEEGWKRVKIEEVPSAKGGKIRYTQKWISYTDGKINRGGCESNV